MSSQTITKEGQIAQLKEKLAQCEKQLSAQKVRKRECGLAAGRGALRWGNFLLVLFVLAAGVCCFLYVKSRIFHWAEVAALGAVVLLGLIRKILGIVQHKRLEKKYGTPAQASHMLPDISRKIEILETEKNRLETQLDRLEYEEYYKLVDATRNDRVIMVVTCEVWPEEEDVPRESRDGRTYYEVDNILDVGIYADGSRIATGKKVLSKNQKCWICSARPGKAQRWMMKIDYTRPGVIRDAYPYPSVWLPWVPGMSSPIAWYHVSANKRYAIVYNHHYNDIEDLRKAVRLTKEDMMKYIK